MLAITILDKPLSTTFYFLESHQDLFFSHNDFPDQIKAWQPLCPFSRASSSMRRHNIHRSDLPTLSPWAATTATSYQWRQRFPAKAQAATASPLPHLPHLLLHGLTAFLSHTGQVGLAWLSRHGAGATLANIWCSAWTWMPRHEPCGCS